VPSTTIPLHPLTIERAYPHLSYQRMVQLAFPDDGSERMFIVTQEGRVFLASRNEADTTPAALFLDIRDRVDDTGNEEGLLGMALDPDFAHSGAFYLYYTQGSPRPSRLSRFTVSATDRSRGDPASEQVLLEVPEPFRNHNGGALLFGPDGYLYLGLGDGGGGGDPQGNGQKLTTLLGKVLRLDVRGSSDGRYRVPPDNPFVGRGGGVREEAWAYGLRNPWRMSFDRATGQLWAGDVGQDNWEEIDLVVKGGNYGWNIMEGSHCYPPSRTTCDMAGLIRPLTEYRNDGANCSVSGGYVYRGRRLPSLFGAYVYGDYCSGRIWALRHDGERVTEQRELADSPLRIVSFAEDPEGELLMLSFDDRIYRLRE